MQKETQEKPDIKALFQEYEERGFTRRFWSPYEQYEDRIGEPFTVMRRVSEQDADLECLPMWGIRFEGGDEIEAHQEEICALKVTVYCDSSGHFSEHQCERDNLCELVFPEQLVFQFFMENWFKTFREDYTHETGKDPGNLDEYDAFWLWYNEVYTADSTDGLCQFAREKGYFTMRDEEPARPNLTGTAVVLEKKDWKLTATQNPDPNYWFEVFLDLELPGGIQQGFAVVRPSYSHAVRPTLFIDRYEILLNDTTKDDFYPVNDPSTGKPWRIRKQLPENLMVPTAPAVLSVALGGKDEEDDVRLEIRRNNMLGEAVVGVTVNGLWWQNLLRISMNDICCTAFDFDEATRGWGKEKWFHTREYFEKLWAGN